MASTPTHCSRCTRTRPTRKPERQIFVTQISTDGFPAYPEAVDLAFAGRAEYGQLIENYRNADGSVSVPGALHPYMRGITTIS